MILALDLDDTLIDTFTVMLAFCNERHEEEFRKEHFVLHDFNAVWGISQEEWRVRFCEFDQSDAARNIPAMPKAQATIATLAKYHTLHVVTARPMEVAKQTTQMVWHLFPGMFAGIHFCTKNYGASRIFSKTEACHMLGADVLIDDHPKHLEGCSPEGIRAYVFNQPWNGNIAHPVVRVPSWDDQVIQALCQR